MDKDLGITLELNTFDVSEKKWLLHLLHLSALAYSYAHKETEQDLAHAEIRHTFIAVLGGEILKRIGDRPTTRDILDTRIYGGDIATLLDRIGNALYRKYIEEKDKVAEVIISKKNLETFNLSPASFIRHANTAAWLCRSFVETKVLLDGQKVVMELSLVF